jgi:Leucine-rich repeat (LRR) protein
MCLHSIPFDLSLAVDTYRLSLDNNLILELPVDWRPLVNLVELRLSNNKIENLPLGLSVLSTLLGLHVQNNRLTNIPVELANLIRLKRLDAVGNSIEEIDVVFGQFWGQLELSLDLKTLKNPPADQFMRTEKSQADILEVLDTWGRSRLTRALSLTHRNIHDFPPISAWTTWEYAMLTSIDLSHNFIKHLPSWIECMTELKILKLTGNPVRRISRRFAFSMSNLTHIDVDWTNMEQNPGLPWIEKGWDMIKEWWIKLQNSSPELRLESLNLAGSNLHEVGLVCGSRLKSLHVKSCQITNLSPYWSLLINLSKLEVDGNALMDVHSIPFQNMQLLSSCSILNCSVSQISDGFFHSKCCLTFLNLSCNNLTMLPISIGLATALTSINLDKNHIASLPETWTSLTSLEMCSIRKNVLSNDNMEELLLHQPKLRSLNLSYNRLQHFPVNPQNHTELQILDVSHNMIPCIKHNNFSLLTKLQKFKANDNMLQEPMLELPIILEIAKDLRCIDFTGNPMSLLPKSCKNNAPNMLELLKTLLSIKTTGEIMADHFWESDTLGFLLTKSAGCLLIATFQNLGLLQHPKDIMMHDVVVLDLSRNCIDHISTELSQLSALKSLSLSNNVIKACKLEDVSLSGLMLILRCSQLKIFTGRMLPKTRSF